MQNRRLNSRRISEPGCSILRFCGRNVSRLLSRRLYVVLSGSMMLMAALAVSSEHAKAEDVNVSKVTSSGGYSKLLSKVKENGTVKVIVKLKTEFTPESLLSTTNADIQRVSIAQAQERLISELASAGHAPSHSHKFKYVPHMAMTTDREALDILLASPDVESIEEDIPVPPVLDKSVPRIGATTLHSRGVTGKGIAVAVLDTGVDKNHPFLKGSVISEACYSTTNTSYSSSSVCPGGVTSSTATGSALPYGGNCPSGECDHGTHVSGIAAGRGGVRGAPGPGVAPEASIIAVQVFSRFDSTDYCHSSPACVLSFTSDQLSGLERVYELRNTYKIASVNMSLGGGNYSSNCDHDSRKSIIDTLKAAGIATAIASGNSYYCGYIGAPACISSAVSVGATDDSDAVADYSNSSSLVSVFAPGSSITSSIPGKRYASWNGTSMATPHVAGSWALIKQSNPNLSVDQILNSFTSTGVSINDSKCPTITKQRINVNEAYSTMFHQLTVTMGGNKKGMVAVDTGTLKCSGNTCAGTYGTGTNVRITGTAAKGSILKEWNGCDSVSSNVCTVTMSANRAVTAVFSPPLKIKVSPMSINFGSIKADAISPSRKVTITNAAGAGAPDLTLSSYQLSGANPSEFKLDTSSCPSRLPRGASCPVYVTATPSSSSFAPRSAVLNINSNAPDNGTVPVKLAAKVSPPVLSVSPKSVNLGKVISGSTSTAKTIIVKNTGLSDLGISSVTLGGNDPSRFTRTNSCSTLAKGASCGITVSFSPASIGARSATLTIVSNAPRNGTVIVKLAGTGK